MSIEVNSLVKIYGTQKAVNNISFSIAKGEIVGFLGPNGAGKSTTMKIITGYLPQDAGTAKVCGIDVTEQGKNKTVLFSTHILQEVQAICDRVIIVNKGELVADDKLSMLQQNMHGNFVRVVFKESLSIEIMQQLPSVTQVIKENDHSWKLGTNNE